MRSTLPFALLACLALAGCNKQEAAAPAASDAATDATAAPAAGTEPSAAAPEWDMSGTPVAGAALTVTPNPVDFCDDRLQSVDVSWDVTGANPTALQIWMDDGSGNRKLWVAPSARTGTKTTGKWMREGARIIALDSTRSRVLNSVTISAAACE